MTGHPYAKINLDTGLMSFHISPSKWIMDINIKGKTIKLLEERKENYPQALMKVR